jgi:hypothetical protein
LVITYNRFDPISKHNKTRVQETTQEKAWKSYARLASTFIFLVAILGLLFRTAAAPSIGSIHGDSAFYCTPDAHFQVAALRNALSDKWNISTMFWITLATGQFSFAQAKVIDVTWDLLISASLLAIRLGTFQASDWKSC